MTNEILHELEDLFIRNKDAVSKFMGILQPKIENANDEYQHLYWHHIYEEEDQRLDRLKGLLPRISFYLNKQENQTIDNLEFIHLLQDVSLEKFGLHNFEEHLDLALFDAESGEHEELLKTMRQMNEEDYEKIKVLLDSLNQAFDGAANRAGSVPTDEKENVNDHLKLEKFVSITKNSNIADRKSTMKVHKRLTVGSLKY